MEFGDVDHQIIMNYIREIEDNGLIPDVYWDINGKKKEYHVRKNEELIGQSEALEILKGQYHLIKQYHNSSP